MRKVLTFHFTPAAASPNVGLAILILILIRILFPRQESANATTF